MHADYCIKKPIARSSIARYLSLFTIELIMKNYTDSVVEFWFDRLSDEQSIPSQSCMLRWWKKDPAFDIQIKQRFEALWQQFSNTNISTSLSTARDYLAVILVLDQFSRNMFRDNTKMYASDPIALTLAKHCIIHRVDQQLRPIERVFVYMPLEHSESIDDQNECVELFTSLYNTADEQHKELFGGFLNYAKAHQQVIAEFGRFPHRNSILGRNSTTAELTYLAKPNSGF